MSKDAILKKFALLSVGGSGIGAWLTENTDPIVFDRLARIETDPLTKVQLNQLLTLGHEAPVSDGFFEYYWLKCPPQHPYALHSLPDYQSKWSGQSAIVSLEHLYWGLYRLFVDGLLYFGNIRTAFRTLRSLRGEELAEFFDRKRMPTDEIRERGPALRLQNIPIDDRYLISEMACKSYGDGQGPGDLRGALIDSLKDHVAGNGGPITIGKLLDGPHIKKQFSERQGEFQFAADDVLNDVVESEAELIDKFGKVAERFQAARSAALENTKLYLSMVNDLDVYVATSMRTRHDFRSMAADCDRIFSAPKLKGLNIRYFDPTLSAASGHEDKGIIECLMVKCSKALVLCAGEKDSYGKDAEAAMALSQGKPVIFYCDKEFRSRFYREVHPLSRLIEFQTGVAVGAMVTDKIAEVEELLIRVFENRMEYKIEQPKQGYLRLHETLSNSVVRLQSSSRLLTETFWNHYHGRDSVRSHDR